MVAAFGGLDRVALTAFVPDGQHVALPEFQGLRPIHAALSAEFYRAGQPDLSHLELLAARVVPDSFQLRYQRNSDSARRTDQAPHEADAAARTTASNYPWLILSSPSSAVKLCSAPMCAS